MEHLLLDSLDEKLFDEKTLSCEHFSRKIHCLFHPEKKSPRPFHWMHGNKKRPSHSFSAVKDERTFTTRGATLFHGLIRALCEIPSYFRQLTYALRRRILSRSL
jgi:hypothetical protein